MLENALGREAVSRTGVALSSSGLYGGFTCCPPQFQNSDYQPERVSASPCAFLLCRGLVATRDRL